MNGVLRVYCDKYKGKLRCFPDEKAVLSGVLGSRRSFFFLSFLSLTIHQYDPFVFLFSKNVCLDIGWGGHFILYWLFKR